MAECEPSFIKKPIILVRPFTVFPASSCGNDVLNVLIRIALTVAIIGCAAFMVVPAYLYLIMGISFIVLLMPTIYTLFSEPAPASATTASGSGREGFTGLGAGGMAVKDGTKFLQFAKPVRNMPMPKEEKGYATIIPNETGSPWTEPTAANPFMNILLTDLKEPNKWRPPIVTALDPESKQKLDDFFRIQWFSDPTDVFGKNQGQRQFYTMPSNSIPNDRKSYQDWLYKIPGKTCKEGNGAACLPGTDGSPVPWLNKDS